MKDLFIDSYGEFNYQIERDSLALRSKIGVFLDIRSGDDYNIGELEFDNIQGVNYNDIIELDNEDIALYIKNKLMNYYPEIKEIKKIEVTRNKINRKLNIYFEFVSVYSNDMEVVRFG